MRGGVDLDALVAASVFSPRSLENPNAWAGHLPFAAWLVRALLPDVCVELGTHSGNSYFSFCQTVVEAGISTRCYAVDTWQGDEHAGLYGEGVFNAVAAYHQEQHYDGFSRLLRMTFDDAAGYFSAASVALLHIDGLHTYEAVRHDFETWLPKLAPGAVVLLHDTNVRERGFGVWKLWEELQAVYPNNLTFVHSHGLGVLQLNDAPDDRRLQWLQPGAPEKQRLTEYFAALGSRQLERYELRDARGRGDGLSQALAARDAQIVELTRARAASEGQVDHLNGALAARDAQIGLLGKSGAEYQDQINLLSQSLADRDGQITRLRQDTAARDGLIAQIRTSTSWRVTAPLRAVRRWTLTHVHGRTV